MQLHQGTGRQLIGCFSAASNITGILADDVATTLLLHQYGALAFWDYAAAGDHWLNQDVLHLSVKFVSVFKWAVGWIQFLASVGTRGSLSAR